MASVPTVLAFLVCKVHLGFMVARYCWQTFLKDFRRIHLLYLDYYCRSSIQTLPQYSAQPMVTVKIAQPIYQTHLLYRSVIFKIKSTIIILHDLESWCNSKRNKERCFFSADMSVSSPGNFFFSCYGTLYPQYQSIPIICYLIWITKPLTALHASAAVFKMK